MAKCKVLTGSAVKGLTQFTHGHVQTLSTYRLLRSSLSFEGYSLHWPDLMILLPVLPECPGSSSGMSWKFFHNVLEVLPECPGSSSGMSWKFFRNVLEVLPECPGSSSVMSWKFFQNVLEVLPECPGSSSGMSRNDLRWMSLLLLLTESRCSRVWKNSWLSYILRRCFRKVSFFIPTCR